MTRSDNSAPQWQIPSPTTDPFVEGVRLAALQSPSAPRMRAKTIPLGERPSISQVPTVTRTSMYVVAIAEENGCAATAAQPFHFAQYQPDLTEQWLLSVIERTQPVTTARLADETNRKVSWVRNKLAKLSAKRLIVGKSRAGGGYCVVKK